MNTVDSSKPQGVGYVQQLALKSLRHWISQEVEGIKAPTLTRLHKPWVLCATKGNPIAVMSIWETLIEAQKNTEFCAFMEGNGVDRASVNGFIEGWERFECGHKTDYQLGLKNDLNGLRDTASVESMKGREIWLPSCVRETFEGRKVLSLNENNPYLCFYKMKSAVSRTMRRLESLDLETVYDLVLTFPKEVNDLSQDNGPEVKERVIKCTRAVFDWLANRVLYGKIGVNANVHVWSSENPLNSHNHVHAILLGDYVKLEKGQKLQDGKREKILPSWFMRKNERTGKYESGYLSNLIKRKWAAIVNKEFNTSYETLDVHIEFIELRDKYQNENVEGYRKLLHKLKYSRRRPISDLALYFTDNKFNPSTNNILWSSFLIDYDNRALTLGYWNRMSKLAVKPVDDLKVKEARCPFCNKKLLYVGLHKSRELPSNVLRVFIDRSNQTYTIT